MADVKINREVKDRLFRMLFQEKKDLLALYNALGNTHYTDPEALEINTLEDAVYIGMKNDLSFLISNTMNLYEHQSTVNANMPLRGLFYLTDLYRGFLEQRGLKLHRSARIPLPCPQYLIFYNGKIPMPERSEMRLSDTFFPMMNGIEPCLDCRAKVLNINLGKNVELMEKCQRLKEYATFIACIREKEAAGHLSQDAIMEAIDECIKNGVLEDFLRKNRGEVLKVVWYEYSGEEYLKDEKEISREEGFREGRDSGLEDGREIGEAKLGRLSLLLLQQNRLEDLKRAAQEPEARKVLYEEFDL